MVNIRARKAVIVATGGSTGNVNFRRMFDPRLTEEYCGLAGMPYSDQDASGEIAAMAVGASLWGAFNQTAETGSSLTKPGQIGTQYGYVNLRWMPGSPMFSKARATGLRVTDWQNVITVNMLGKRFYDETGRQFTANAYKGIDPYSHGSYLNAKNVRFDPNNWINAAMAGIGDGKNGGGPIWAIFDQAAAEREKWDRSRRTSTSTTDSSSWPTPSRSSPEDHDEVPARADAAAKSPRTVGDYNSYVDVGRDFDFGKPRPLHTIAKPPFYAAWATPVLHDTRAGLRINARCQVVDMNGEVIAGLYCGGELAGGFGMHGLPRCTCQGYIAGKNAAAESRRRKPVVPWRSGTRYRSYPSRANSFRQACFKRRRHARRLFVRLDLASRRPTLTTRPSVTWCATRAISPSGSTSPGATRRPWAAK